MGNLNLCQFIGRLARDPETGYSKSGDTITNVTLAVDDSYKDKSGQKVDKCEWVNITFYRKLAEIISEYCVKGQLIYVSGKMETRKYTDKNGVEKHATNIIAHNMQMLSSNPKNTQNETNTNTKSGGFDDSDDVPF